MSTQKKFVILVIVILMVAVTVGSYYIMQGLSGAYDLTMDEMKRKYERPGSRYATYDGVTFHFLDEGEGPPLVLLHGSSSTLGSWDGVVDRLKDRYRLIRWDRPDSGLSSVDPSAVPSEADLAGLLLKLLDDLDVTEPVTILSTSSAGTTATRFANAYPERADRLVIANAPSSPISVPRSERPFSVAAYMMWSDDLMHHRSQGFWRTYLGYLWGDPARLSDATVDQAYDSTRLKRERLPRQLMPSGGADEAIQARLAQVVHPVLMVWGMDSPVQPPYMLDQYVERLTNAPVKTVRLEGVGHYPATEVPERFADAVAEWLARPVAR